MVGSPSSTLRSGSGRLTPFGRPVVPELYSIVMPMGWVASGSAGWEAIASS